MAILALKLRMNHGSMLATVGRFAVVGVVNTALDMALFLALVKCTSLPVVVANTISYSCGVLNSFLLNRYWTFSRQAHQHSMGRQFALFIGANFLGLVISDAVVASLRGALGPVLAKIVSVAVVFAWNFAASRWLVYRPVSTHE